jgi:hypothetical protein
VIWRAGLANAYEVGCHSTDVAFGSNSEVESHSRRIRSNPMNGHRQTGPTGPFRAKPGTDLSDHDICPRLPAHPSGYVTKMLASRRKIIGGTAPDAETSNVIEFDARSNYSASAV